LPCFTCSAPPRSWPHDVARETPPASRPRANLGRSPIAEVLDGDVPGSTPNGFIYTFDPTSGVIRKKARGMGGGAARFVSSLSRKMRPQTAERPAAPSPITLAMRRE
jgi:hypothetical protein